MIIHEVEQNSDEWYQLRAGKPTASDGDKLVTSKGEPSKQMPEYAIQLAADLYAGEPLDHWEGNKATERGHEMEDRARAYYENTFPTRSIERPGFITDDGGLAGASPDGLVIDGDAMGILELKCFTAKRHVGVILFYQRNGRLPADYIVQPQMQLHVIDVARWNDMLFWHPELPPLLVRHTRDEKIQVNLGLQIQSCIDERDRIIQVLREF